MPSSLLLSLHLLPLPGHNILAEGVPRFDAFLLDARALVLQLFYFPESGVALARDDFEPQRLVVDQILELVDLVLVVGLGHVVHALREDLAHY